jgi:hypothetical protein
MATDLDVLRVRLEADISDLQRSFKQAERTVQGSTSKMDQTMTRSFKRMGLAAGVAVGAVALAAVQFGKHSVRMAADAEEMRSQFDAVFKDSSADVRRWSDDLASRLGRSSQDIQNFAAEFQDTFVPLGFARGQAAELSKTMTQLTLDLASFKNVKPEEAARLFQSALVGNHEAVRRFGIAITEASLKTELMKQGFRGNAAEASQLQKVMARLAIIQNSSADAQGDAERTAESTQNTFLRLDAATDDLARTVGTILTPTVRESAAALADWVRAADNFLTVFKTDTALNSITQITERIEDYNAALLSMRNFNAVFGRGDTDAIKDLEKRIFGLAAARQKLVGSGAVDPGFVPEGADLTVPGLPKQIDKAAEKARMMQAEIKRLIGTLDGSPESMRRAEASLAAYSKALQDGADGAVEVNQAQLKANLALKDSEERFKVIADVVKNAETPQQEYTRRLRTLNEIVKQNPDLQDAATAALARYKNELIAADPVLRNQVELQKEQMQALGQFFGEGQQGLDNYIARQRALSQAQAEGKLDDKERVLALTKQHQALLRVNRENALLKETIEGSIDPFTQYRENMTTLIELYERGAISSGQLAHGQMRLNANLIESVPILGKMRDGAIMFSDALVEGLIRGENMMDVLSQTFRQMAIEFAKMAVRMAIMGQSGGSGGGGGGLFGGGLGGAIMGGVFSGLMSSIGSYAGGGFNFMGTGMSGASFLQGATTSGGLTSGVNGGLINSTIASPMARGGAILPRASQGMVATRPTDIRVAETQGAEAILPLAMSSKGELGVKATGGSGPQNIMNISIDARGADAGAVKRIEKAVMEIDRTFSDRAVKSVRNERFRDPRLLEGPAK